jgi:four helix bundle protein
MRNAEYQSMNNDDLNRRKKDFALRVLRMSEAMPRSIVGDVLTRPIVRSATSVAANHRSACRAKSRADFVNKMGTVKDEAGGTALWLELIAEGEFLPPTKTSALHAEARELTAIAVSSIRTARACASNPQSAVRNL